jgi:cytochrome c oxidase assembly protein subunit 15
LESYSFARLFRRFGVITIVAVYLLILVGGIVRSTGAGMGCPDWPKCFGQWIPPTDVSQLPTDYKERFAVAGKVIADFDTFKTWTEYVNRLIGVLIGLFIFITFVFSIGFFKTDRIIFYNSLASFLMVVFQGWLGAKVVATNLKPLIITLHMILALLIVAVLIYAVARSFHKVVEFGSVQKRPKLNQLLILCLFFSLVQIALGTQVREAIDHISAELNYGQRETWIDSLGISFYIHRSFSLLIFGVHTYFAILLARLASSQLYFWAKILIGLLALEILSGVILAYFAIPPIMQPVHLLLASLIFGVQFLLLLMLNYEKVFKTQNQKIYQTV